MAMRYNSPPGWPLPPAGWTPLAGWQPDSAWGPAPQGWQFWVQEASRFRQEFWGIVIEDATIFYQRVPQPIAGCQARVETAGDIQQRVTATRMLVTGPFAFAFKKKQDDRELYLTIDGPVYQWVLSCHPRLSGQARQFAAVVNTCSRQMMAAN